MPRILSLMAVASILARGVTHFPPRSPRLEAYRPPAAVNAIVLLIVALALTAGAWYARRLVTVAPPRRLRRPPLAGDELDRNVQPPASYPQGRAPY